MNIQITAQNIHNRIQQYESNPNLFPELIEDMVRDILLDDVEEFVQEPDIARLEQHGNNDVSLESYFTKRFPDYPAKLEQITTDILTEYISTDLANDQNLWK